MAEEYDVVVIGGGAVGENAASRAAQDGLAVALVEAELIGGECTYWACMPSKALLRPGNALAAARRVAGARQAVGGDLDAAAVLANRDAFASNWDDGPQLAWAQGAGLTVIRGRARLAGERTIDVEGADSTRRLWARKAVVLCTGSVPVIPPVEGLSEVELWTSRQATSAEEAPVRLAVLGGGVVAAELAQAFARLGSQVTVIEQADRLLPGMEPIAGELVAAGLRDDGVDVRLGTRVRRASRQDGIVRVDVAGGHVVEADELLVATGRRPATGDLGLETIGLEPGEPLAVSDDGAVTGVGGEWLYAAGDVTGRAPLTHQGKYAARVVGDVLAARARGQRADPVPWTRFAATADHVAVPQVVFTDPEVAAVGRTAEQARAQGVDLDVVDLDIAVAGSAVHADGYTGRARMVVDTERKLLVGVTFVGQDVAELAHAATIAIAGEVPLHRLWHAVPVFPTISEVWLRLLESYDM
ncbi:MAG: pyridine nucleotide-disulfide oxidoreductase [Pseudonocardiaceae bacterium]|nr:pyridine nucleotide-disulfide oxidoreductase [Pseudonocardiaceae bacterium]